MQRFYIWALLSAFVLFFSECKNPKTETGEIPETADSSDLTEGEAITFLTDSIGDTIEAATGQIILRFNPPEGKTYHASMRTVTSIKQIMFGQTFNSHMDIATSNAITIQENASETITLKSKVEAFKATMKQDTLIASFENGKPSEDPEIDMLRKIMDCYVDMPIAITMDRNTDVTNVTGIQEVQEKISTSLGQEAVMASMQMSDMNQEILNSFVAFPNKPVSKGDTWNSIDSVDLGGFPTVMTNTYTLTDYDKTYATVDVQSTFKIDKAMMREMGATGDEVKLNGTQSGSMKVVIASGWSIESRLDQKLNLSMDAEGEEMKITISGTSTLSTK